MATLACALALSFLLGAWSSSVSGLSTPVAAVQAPEAGHVATGKPMTTSPYTSSAQVEARFAGEDFVPDGNLSKSAWKRAEWVEFDHDMSGRRAYPEARTRAAVVWTKTAVYFAFSCRYVSVNSYQDENADKERWELWNRDVVEVFLNPGPERVNHYYEYEVAPNNQWIDLEIDKDKTPFNDASWDSHFLHATHVDAATHVWTCEMRIPVAAMGVGAMPPGRDWRVNLYRADGPGDDSHRRFMSWSTIPEGTTFHVPTRFGLMRFVK